MAVTPLRWQFVEHEPAKELKAEFAEMAMRARVIWSATAVAVCSAAGVACLQQRVL
jgi:hypothetical protein